MSLYNCIACEYFTVCSSTKNVEVGKEVGDRISVNMGFNLGMYITSLCFICYGK